MNEHSIPPSLFEDEAKPPPNPQLLVNLAVLVLLRYSGLLSEIVVLDEKGRSDFHDLMARRGEARYYAFDLMWLNGIDLRSQPLLERKRKLRRLIPANDSHLLYVEHLDGDGQRFFELVCEQDLEGIICKPKTSPYPFTWIKVNPNYSQAVGRREWFDRLLPRR